MTSADDKGAPSAARIAAGIGVLIIVGVLIWLLLIKDDGDDGASKTISTVPADQVAAQVVDLGYPVYWIGALPDTEYEVTEITDGRTYVRYVPPGTQAGANIQFLTVGSYLFNDPYAALTKLGTQAGNSTFKVPGGGIGLESTDQGQSVYVAYPEIDVQVEVFDPNPGQARKLARAGAVVPVN